MSSSVERIPQKSIPGKAGKWGGLDRELVSDMTGKPFTGGPRMVGNGLGMARIYSIVTVWKAPDRQSLAVSG
jgi:hypothetical protein